MSSLERVTEEHVAGNNDHGLLLKSSIKERSALSGWVDFQAVNIHGLGDRGRRLQAYRTYHMADG